MDLLEREQEDSNFNPQPLSLMNTKYSALLLVAVLGLCACRSTDHPVRPTLPGYTLVFLKTGPKSGQLSGDENGRALAGHFSNMKRMNLERQLIVAGPFGENRHDPSLRGIFILASGDRERARGWAATDPATQAGLFELEYHQLETDAPLEAVLERNLERLERARAEGRQPTPGEGARAYVILTAENADLAKDELDLLQTSDGGVFLLGRLDGTRAFAILDAGSLDAAEERFGAQFEQLGSYALDEWYATDQLAGMVD